jgi:chromosome segregation ATPase
LQGLIKTIQEEVKGNKLHLHTLNKEKSELEDELEALSNRLKSILREKEILFSKLMSAERTLE